MILSRLISRIIAIGIVVTIFGYLAIANTTPFNIAKSYTSNNKNTFLISPRNRAEIHNGVTKQIDNLIYFNSKMPFSFDLAKVKIYLKNNSSQQEVRLGYKDQLEWHYSSQIIDSPMLDSLKQQRIGSGPYLYQKTSTYKSVDDFFKNPPKNKVVGVADYKNTDFLQPNIVLPNYRPSSTKTRIDVPLRGKTVMYAYLNHEPFSMSFTKRDLNWQSDPDAVKISVYKGKDKVFVAAIDDDGNSTSNHQVGHPETVEIKNPGPGLPEPGVYKIFIDATDDSVITNITTNLHKLAFEGPLYAADNHEVYGDLAAKTKATYLNTNAPYLSFRSDHEQSKTATVDKQVVKITKPNQVFDANNPAPSTNITVHASDMIINGNGYFAFAPEQFFVPSPYRILPINSAEDIAKVDYILTDYKTPKHEGEWLVAEREFDLHDAVIKKGQLSWLLSAPGLKENNRTVEYKQIDMTLTKKGWFKQ
jgi:hypothetical protein